MSLAPDILRSQITEARKRLAELMREQRKVNQEIADLRELIRANANFLSDEERAFEITALEFLRFPTNVTEAVRLVLLLATVTGRSLTPTQIRGVAEHIGFDFSEYSNPMASIHTILKRMREVGEAKYDEAGDGYCLRNSENAGDLLNPELIVEIYRDVAKEILKGSNSDKTVNTALEASIAKKAERFQRK
jgi:hypothetical protein